MLTKILRVSALLSETKPKKTSPYLSSDPVHGKPHDVFTGGVIHWHPALVLSENKKQKNKKVAAGVFRYEIVQNARPTNSTPQRHRTDGNGNTYYCDLQKFLTHTRPLWPLVRGHGGKFFLWPARGVEVKVTRQKPKAA